MLLYFRYGLRIRIFAQPGIRIVLGPIGSGGAGGRSRISAGGGGSGFSAIWRIMIGGAAGNGIEYVDGDWGDNISHNYLLQYILLVDQANFN